MPKLSPYYLLKINCHRLILSAVLTLGTAGLPVTVMQAGTVISAPIISDRLEYAVLPMYPGECSVAAQTKTTVSSDGFLITTPCDPDGRVNILKEVEILGSRYRVTEISWGGFERCNLDTLRIPSTVTAIGNQAFQDSKVNVTLTGAIDVIGHYAFAGVTGSVRIEEGVRYIYDNAFGGFMPDDDTKEARTLVLPSTIQTLGRTIIGTGLNGKTDAAFDYVQCHCMTPPDIEEGPDGEVDLCTCSESYQRITLLVPREAIEIYRDAPGWCKFTNILPVEGSGIENVYGEVELKIDVAPGRCLILSDDPRPIPVKIYTSEGRQIYFGHDREIPLAPGYYIVRASTTSEKIMIK